MFLNTSGGYMDDNTAQIINDTTVSGATIQANNCLIIQQVGDCMNDKEREFMRLIREYGNNALLEQFTKKLNDIKPLFNETADQSEEVNHVDNN